MTARTQGVCEGADDTVESSHYRREVNRLKFNNPYPKKAQHRARCGSYKQSDR